MKTAALNLLDVSCQMLVFAIHGPAKGLLFRACVRVSPGVALRQDPALKYLLMGPRHKCECVI